MPHHDTEPMDNRWKVGDEALCLMRKPWRGFKHRRLLPEPTPKFGKTYKVTWIDLEEGRLFLSLQGLPRAWAERFFIKATPSSMLRAESLIINVPAKETINVENS